MRSISRVTDATNFAALVCRALRTCGGDSAGLRALRRTLDGSARSHRVQACGTLRGEALALQALCHSLGLLDDLSYATLLFYIFSDTTRLSRSNG